MKIRAVFKKDFGGWSGHPPVFRKGDEVFIVDVLSYGYKVEHLWGEPCGYSIPWQYLEKRYATLLTLG